VSNFKEKLAHTRGKRQYIARIVNSLLEISGGDRAALQNISWDKYLALPSWCLLDFEKLESLQIACGAIHLQPLVKSSLDGAVLVQFKESVGESLFNFLFESVEDDNTQELPDVVLSPDGSIPQTIKSVGASVLLGTLSDADVIKIYMPVTGKPLIVLSGEQANRSLVLASQAMKLEKTSGQTKPAEQTTENISEASSL